MKVLQRELAKLGVTLSDDRDLIPAWECPAIASVLGITFYAPGSKYNLPSGTPVVAITHDEGNDVDAATYGVIDDFVNDNIVGLFVK